MAISLEKLPKPPLEPEEAPPNATTPGARGSGPAAGARCCAQDPQRRRIRFIMTMPGSRRAAIYARYSSDMQSVTSIDDQVRLCRRLCTERGWSVVEVFSDQAIS